jgi:hypothetical protein
VRGKKAVGNSLISGSRFGGGGDGNEAELLCLKGRKEEGLVSYDWPSDRSAPKRVAVVRASLRKK